MSLIGEHALARLVEMGRSAMTPPSGHAEDIVLQAVWEVSKPSRVYWLMNALAAVIACYGLLADSTAVVTIVPHGIGALGYTMQRPIDDRFLVSRAELKGKMAVLLGGRSAEALVFGEISTGAADGLDKATHIARSMVTRFGMSAELGQMAYETPPDKFLGNPASMSRQYSEQTAREIDCAVRALMDEAAKTAMEILRTYRPQLKAGAKNLLDKETLLPDELPVLPAIPSTPIKIPDLRINIQEPA